MVTEKIVRDKFPIYNEIIYINKWSSIIYNA